MAAVTQSGTLTPEMQLALVQLENAISGTGSRVFNNTTINNAISAPSALDTQAPTIFAGR